MTHAATSAGHPTVTAPMRKARHMPRNSRFHRPAALIFRAAAERRTHVVAPARMATMRHSRLHAPRPSQGNVAKEGASTVAFRHPEESTAERCPVIQDAPVKNSTALEFFANDAGSEQTPRSHVDHGAGERQPSANTASASHPKAHPPRIRRANLLKNRSAKGPSASVGRAERIPRSDSRDWPGWIRPSPGGSEELPSHAQGRIFRVGADRP